MNLGSTRLTAYVVRGDAMFIGVRGSNWREVIARPLPPMTKVV